MRMSAAEGGRGAGVEVLLASSQAELVCFAFCQVSLLPNGWMTAGNTGSLRKHTNRTLGMCSNMHK